VCCSKPTVYAYVLNFVWIGLFCHPLLAKNPNFCRFWTSAFNVFASWQQSVTKLNTGAQLQTFPYPTASKLFLYFNAFLAKSGAQSLTFKSMTDKQTDKQTKKLNVLATPAAGKSEPNNNNLQPLWKATPVTRKLKDAIVIVTQRGHLYPVE